MQARTTSTSYDYLAWKKDYETVCNQLSAQYNTIPLEDSEESDRILIRRKKNKQEKAIEKTNERFRLMEKKSELETYGNFFALHHHPQQLCQQLIKDTRKLLNDYDLTHPIEQSDILRYSIREITETVNTLENKTRYSLQTAENAADFQQYFKESANALANIAHRLREQGVFFEKYCALLKKQFIAITLSDSTIPRTLSLSDDEKKLLAKKEVGDYQNAIYQLKNTVDKLPNSMATVKKNTYALIDRAEAKRMICEEGNCTGKKTHFDYKRHTLNLKKTNALLASPTNEKIQREYQLLIKNNGSNRDTRFQACLLMIFGAVMIALGMTIMPLMPLGIILATGGSANFVAGAGFFANTLKPTTKTMMSDVYKHMTHLKPSSR